MDYVVGSGWNLDLILRWILGVYSGIASGLILGGFWVDSGVDYVVDSVWNLWCIL